MTADNKFERLIEPVIGPDPNTVSLSSPNVARLREMVVSDEESFVESRLRDVERDRERLDFQAANAVQDLTETERRVLQLRFGLVKGGAQPLSLRRIGAELGKPKS